MCFLFVNLQSAPCNSLSTPAKLRAGIMGLLLFLFVWSVNSAVTSVKNKKTKEYLFIIANTQNYINFTHFFVLFSTHKYKLPFVVPFSSESNIFFGD